MAHIRSILPQRGGVAPVDSNTTFLAHYDADTKDALRSFKAIGTDMALYVDGSVYIDTGLANFVAAERDFTVEATICPSTTTLTDSSGTEKMVLGWAGWHEGFVYNETSGLATLQVHFVSSDGTTTQRDIVTAPVAKGEWAHITCVYQMNPRKLFIYKDGALANSLDISTTRSGWTFKSYTSNAIMGRVGSNYRYTGNVSEARIWSKALSQSEIISNLSGNFSDTTNLVGYWRLGEGTGTVVNESTGTLTDIVLPTGTSWTQGRPSYALISGGYPGGTGSGVFLEEGTTNVITNPTTPSTWSNNTDPTYGFVSSTIIDTDFGIQGMRKVVQTQTTTDYRGTLTSIPWTTPTDMTKPWAFTIYARVVSQTGTGANISLNYQGADSTGARVDLNTSWTLTSNWQRISIIKTPATDSTFASIITYMKVYTNPPGGVGNQATIDIVMPQMEQKSYPTSFVNGTRRAPLLTYPITPVSDSAGTISMWVNPQQLIAAGSAYPMIFRIANNIFEWDIYSNKLSINSCLITPSTNIQTGSWYFLAYKWDDSVPSQTLYLFPPTGTMQQVASATATPSLTGQSQFFIGSGANNGAYPSNCIIDEVRIDSIARTDDEISSWYYQGMNGW